MQILNIDVSGTSKNVAGKIIMNKINKVSQEGINFSYKDTHISLTPTVSSFSPDSAYPVYLFDVEQTINKAYQVGRENGFWGNLQDKLITYIKNENINIKYEIKEEEAKKILQDNFKQYEDPATNAKLQVILQENKNENINISIIPEKAGEAIDYDHALGELGQRLEKLDAESPIRMSIYEQKPEIYEKDCQNIEEKAKNTFKKSPLRLQYANKDSATTPKTKNNKNNYSQQEWNIGKKQLSQWLTLGKNKGEIKVVASKEKIKNYLKDNMAPKIDEEPIDAKFRMENGKVSEFRDSKPGKKVNIEKTADKIVAAMEGEDKKEISLEVNVIKTEYTTNKINNIGINEIIGSGHSNFYGSPVNRIHNIKIGANSIQGILVKPGEKFSLNQAIGKVNKKSGYLPELVIKGNKTIPEYGGGLCQIGTTMFRSALNSGLTISERQNHSYRVSYYEPPVGIDATIYKPHPDLEFINDTQHHILIQTRIEGYDLYFDIWGEDDGRTVEISEPVVYGITHPQEPQIIETTELKPGEKKCTESAHNGATAYFDYKVDYKKEGKENKERRFYSYYKPWREKCLVGMADEKENEKENESKKNVSTTTAINTQSEGN